MTISQPLTAYATPSSNINLTSGKVEWYTPRWITQPAQDMMGGIDLDPATSVKANQYGIHANRIYTAETNGLGKEWFGKVWLNHPFGKPEKPCSPLCTKKTCKKRGHHNPAYKPGSIDWITHYLDQYTTGNITESITITYVSPDTAWGHKLFAYPNLFFNKRIAYIDGNTLKPINGVQKPSMLTYLGNNLTRFKLYFREYGTIK